MPLIEFELSSIESEMDSAADDTLWNVDDRADKTKKIHKITG